MIAATSSAARSHHRSPPRASNQRCLLELPRAASRRRSSIVPSSSVAAAPEPPLELLERRRLQEDEERFGHARPHLFGALHVDLQDDVAPRGEQLLHRSARRSGPVADDLRPLQELVRSATIRSNAASVTKW